MLPSSKALWTMVFTNQGSLPLFVAVFFLLRTDFWQEQFFIHKGGALCWEDSWWEDWQRPQRCFATVWSAAHWRPEACAAYLHWRLLRWGLRWLGAVLVNEDGKVIKFFRCKLTRDEVNMVNLRASDTIIGRLEALAMLLGWKFLAGKKPDNEIMLFGDNEGVSRSFMNEDQK